MDLALRRLRPIGFWSYARQDDNASDGRLNHLRRRLTMELQQLYGREPIQIWQDIGAIPPGAEWEKSIDDAISLSTFLIPIVTPAFVESEWCCHEVRKFLEREAEINTAHPELKGRRRIFPISYVSTRDCEPFDPHVMEELRKLQHADFTQLRHADDGSGEVRRALARLAEEMNAVLKLRLRPRSATEGRTDGFEALAPMSAGYQQSPETRAEMRQGPAQEVGTRDRTGWRSWLFARPRQRQWLLWVASTILVVALAWVATRWFSPTSAAPRTDKPPVVANKSRTPKQLPSGSDLMRAIRDATVRSGTGDRMAIARIGGHIRFPLGVLLDLSEEERVDAFRAAAAKLKDGQSIAIPFAPPREIDTIAIHYSKLAEAGSDVGIALENQPDGIQETYTQGATGYMQWDFAKD